jgi:hypothetical protein
MADPPRERLDDRVDRYKAKVWTYAKSCSRSDRIFLLAVLVLIPLAWYGFIYWMVKVPSFNDMSTGQEIGFWVAWMFLMVLTFIPIIHRFGALVELAEHIFSAFVILPPLWIYQKCKRTFSALPLLLVPLSRVCTIRTRHDWHEINSFGAQLCKECQRIATKSTLLNGSTWGVAYSVEKYRHHNFTALTYSAQQCHLCNLFLNSAQQCWKTELESATTEKKLSELQVELKAVKIPKGGSSVLLRLRCMGLPGYVTLTVDEIHKSKPERLWLESTANIPRPGSFSIRNQLGY